MSYIKRGSRLKEGLCLPLALPIRSNRSFSNTSATILWQPSHPMLQGQDSLRFTYFEMASESIPSGIPRISRCDSVYTRNQVSIGYSCSFFPRMAQGARNTRIQCFCILPSILKQGDIRHRRSRVVQRPQGTGSAVACLSNFQNGDSNCLDCQARTR